MDLRQNVVSSLLDGLQLRPCLEKRSSTASSKRKRSDGCPGCRAWFLVDRPYAHWAAELLYPVVTDRDAVLGEVGDHPAITAAGIIQTDGLDPGHDPRGRFMHQCEPVVEGRSRQPLLRELVWRCHP